MKNKKEKEKVIEQLRLNSIVALACQIANVSRATYYRWLEKDEKFRQKVEEAKSEGFDVINDLAESKLIVAIKNGEFKAINYRLSRCHPTYSDKKLGLSDSDQEKLSDNINNKRIEDVLLMLINKSIRGEIPITATIKYISAIVRIYPKDVNISKQELIRNKLNALGNLIDELSPRGRKEDTTQQDQKETPSTT